MAALESVGAATAVVVLSTFVELHPAEKHAANKTEIGSRCDIVLLLFKVSVVIQCKRQVRRHCIRSASIGFKHFEMFKGL